MKVVDYVWIEKTSYIGVHRIGVLCDNGNAYACTKFDDMLKVGEFVVEHLSWPLGLGDRFYPLTKLHRFLYGI